MTEQELGLNQEPEQKPLSFDEALARNAAAQEESQKGRTFVTIADHESLRMEFSGRIFPRTATGTDNQKAWTSPKLDFELVAKTPDGKNRLWSVGANNSIVRDVIDILKKGQRSITVHREGTGTSTKYSIAKERSL